MTMPKRTVSSTTSGLFPSESTEADTITSIDALPGNPNRRRVRVGRRTVATLWAQDVEVLRLSPGAAWTRRLADAAAALTARTLARQDAMKLLGKRALASAVVREKLAAKGHDTTVAEQVVRQLVADGWLDDRETAQAVVRGVVRKGPAGQTLLKERLLSRGLPDAIVEETVRQATAKATPFESALAAAQRQLQRDAHLDPAKAMRRAASMLARRGFEEDIIADAIASCGFDRETA
jgi:regulatory protein